MIALVEAVYLPPGLFHGGQTLLGSDYQDLHMQRIAFARQAVLSGRGLPAWYPYDFLGAPFAANLQIFPSIPTRRLLLLIDPEGAYAAGAALAAALAAGFTFLFCRRAGLSSLGAAAAGWTFACAGFFPSRVAVLFLALRCWIAPRRPAQPWMFLAALGLGALVCSLPLTQLARALLRSPARLIYLSTFAASAALGAAVDAVLSAVRLRPLFRWGIVGVTPARVSWSHPSPATICPTPATLDGAHVYRVPGAAPRAEFLPPPGTVRYAWPSSDEIALQTNSPRDGHVRLLEADDPGWTATVDGQPAPVADSGGMALAVPVPAGCHAIRLRYHTPGRTVGLLLSLLSSGLLAILICTGRPRSGSGDPGTGAIAAGK